MFNSPLQQDANGTWDVAARRRYRPEVSGITVRVPEFLVTRYGRLSTRCYIKTFFARFMIYEVLANAY